MISVIIPAYNEAGVIGRCLEAIAKPAHEGELEVIVVANGCTDCTAQYAREFGHGVRVIETDMGSKIHALNLGDQAATCFPRFYIDADIEITLAAIRQMAAELNNGKILAIAPLPEINLTRCSWMVRAFYQINGLLPSSQEGIGGSGVYGLSQEGRQRFAQFPQLTADDGFVRIHFRPEERTTLRTCRSIVSAPKSLKNLVAIKTRSHYGSYELQKLFPELWFNCSTRNRQVLVKLCADPVIWPKLGAYIWVKLFARWRARARMRAGLHNVWERDQTSRIMLIHSGRAND